MYRTCLLPSGTPAWSQSPSHATGPSHRRDGKGWVLLRNPAAGSPGAICVPTPTFRQLRRTQAAAAQQPSCHPPASGWPVPCPGSPPCLPDPMGLLLAPFFFSKIPSLSCSLSSSPSWAESRGCSRPGQGAVPLGKLLTPHFSSCAALQLSF